MRKLQTALMMVLTLAIMSPAWAADKAKEKKAPPCPAAQRADRLTEGLTLSADQKAKVEAVCKELGPKMMDVMKKSSQVLNAEQKKAQAEAIKAAKDASKSVKEQAEAGTAAAKPTDEQKAKLAEIRKEMGALEKDLREKVMGALTTDQQEQVKKKLDAGKKKAAK